MKTLINILLFSCLLTNSTFPQFYADSTISDYVIEFMKIADEKIKNMDDFKNTDEGLNDDELEHVAWLYYKCHNENPSVFYNYIFEENKKWNERSIDKNKTLEELKPQTKIVGLGKKIAAKYGVSFLEVSNTPALIRAKFIKMIPSSFDTIRVISTSMRLDFIFLIEDVLKADKFFTIGDTLKIVGNIGGSENPRPHLDINISYLIPVQPRIIKSDFKGWDNYNGELMIKYLHNSVGVWEMGSYKVFPIIDEKITNCEYFGISDTSWTDFKKYFKEKYLIFN